MADADVRDDVAVLGGGVAAARIAAPVRLDLVVVVDVPLVAAHLVEVLAAAWLRAEHGAGGGVGGVRYVITSHGCAIVAAAAAAVLGLVVGGAANRLGDRGSRNGGWDEGVLLLLMMMRVMRVMRVMGMLLMRLRLRLLVVDILLKMLLLWMMLRIMSLFLLLLWLILQWSLLVLRVGVPIRRGVHADDWLQGGAAVFQQTRVVVVVTGLVMMDFVTLTFTLIMIILLLLGVDLAVLAGAVVLLKVGDPVWILVSAAGFGCGGGSLICRSFGGAVAVLIT